MWFHTLRGKNRDAWMTMKIMMNMLTMMTMTTMTTMMIITMMTMTTMMCDSLTDKPTTCNQEMLAHLKSVFPITISTLCFLY